MAKASKYANKEVNTPVAQTTDETKPEAAASSAQVAATVSAVRGAVTALAFVEAGGTALSSALLSYALAKEAESMGPLNLFCFYEFSIEDAQRDLIPEIGSKQGETGNKPYDRYTAKIKDGGVERSVPGSWFTDVRNNTEACKQIDVRIDWCDGKGDGAMPDAIQKMGTGERIAERKRLVNQKNYMRNALTKGAMLWHHVRAIDAINPTRIVVKMPIKMEPQGQGKEPTPKLTGPMIRLTDPTAEFEHKSFTVSEFLSLDPAKLAKPDTATIVDLENTKARKPKGKTTGKSTGYEVVLPRTVEQFLTFCNVGHTAIDPKADEGKMMIAKLLAECVAEGKKGDDATETIGDFLTALDNELWAPIVGKYTKIKSARAETQGTKIKTAA